MQSRSCFYFVVFESSFSEVDRHNLSGWDSLTLAFFAIRILTYLKVNFFDFSHFRLKAFIEMYCILAKVSQFKSPSSVVLSLYHEKCEQLHFLSDRFGKIAYCENPAQCEHTHWFHSQQQNTNSTYDHLKFKDFVLLPCTDYH